MGLFSSDAGKATIKGAQQIGKNVEIYHRDTDAIVRAAEAKAAGALGQASDILSPLAALGQQGSTMYANSLGLNGAGGNAAATAAFQAGPGYEWQMGQGLDALERRAAAQGRLQSGQTGLDTLTYAQGLANQAYGGWQDRLSGYNDMYSGALGSLAGIQGGLADLAVGSADRRTDIYGNALGVNTQATQMFAGGQESRAAAKQAGLGSLLGIGGKILGMATGGLGGGGLGGLGTIFGYGK
jgi:hypothetical protein